MTGGLKYTLTVLHFFTWAFDKAEESEEKCKRSISLKAFVFKVKRQRKHYAFVEFGALRRVRLTKMFCCVLKTSTKDVEFCCEDCEVLVDWKRWGWIKWIFEKTNNQYHVAFEIKNFSFLFNQHFFFDVEMTEMELLQSSRRL